MNAVRVIWLLLCVVWISAEIKLACANRLEAHATADSEQRTQVWLWLSVLASLGLALWFKTWAWLPIPLEYLPRQLLAMLLFAAGLALRYRAVGQLGRLFTTHVTILHEHRLITDGPYRWVRHPAYTGLLLALAAAGLAMGDVLALLILTLPTGFAFLSRIALEEALLEKKFGSAYRDYRKTTRKLLPWLY